MTSCSSWLRENSSWPSQCHVTWMETPLAHIHNSLRHILFALSYSVYLIKFRSHTQSHTIPCCWSLVICCRAPQRYISQLSIYVEPNLLLFVGGYNIIYLLAKHYKSKERICCRWYILSNLDFKYYITNAKCLEH